MRPQPLTADRTPAVQKEQVQGKAVKTFENSPKSDEGAMKLRYKRNRTKVDANG